MKLLNTILLIFFSITQLSAQYRVSSCEETGLRPIDPVQNIDILRHLYEDPAQPGCWVHHHNNGADFVVTPKGWGDVPNDVRQKQIHEAMQALTQSREAFREFGNLSTNLYYILDDNERRDPGEAFWIVNKSCWMLSGLPNVSSLSAIDRLQIYAHEIGHCLIMENMQNYSGGFPLNRWLDESVAEYLSSQAYPDNNFEYRWSNVFEFSEPFRQAYNAYPLWKYYVDNEGKNKLFPMMQSLANGPTLASRRSIMQRTDFDATLHNFYFDFYRGKLMDESGGAIPANTGSLFTISYNLDPASSSLRVYPLDMDELHGIELVIPAGYDLDIDPLDGPSAALLHQSLIQGSDYQIRDWNTKKKIKGACDDEVRFLVLASHCNNNSLDQLHFDYRLTKKEKLDCCDPAIPGDCDECLAPAGDESPMGANPVEDISSMFKFDYKIESVIRYEMDMTEVNEEYFKNNSSREVVMNYYVNSADGSMFFPGGITGFFETNFSIPANFGKVDAAIRLANGQIVTYGYDAKYNQKRAGTRGIKQTAEELKAKQLHDIMLFFRSSRELREHPDPMPAYVQWDNITQGYKAIMLEGETRIENTWTIYFDTKPTPIKTSCVMMGHMVGVMKDVSEKNCNRLVVYNKTNIGGDGSGEFMETYLKSIKPMGISFDGADYKPMQIPGERGTAVKNKIKDLEAQIMVLQREKETLKEQRKNCRDKTCRDRIDERLERIAEEIEHLVCQMAKVMGMEDKIGDCN